MNHKIEKNLTWLWRKRRMRNFLNRSLYFYEQLRGFELFQVIQSGHIT